ncbi:hypothetical protein LOZ66_004977 [Ophidiomyces ophidiicola]|nr:hypothetical protein LOZ66_004977 [Ophidiomyces ophidiicola]
MSTSKPIINEQKLLNRIQQLEKATQALSQQNLELKNHNQQLEVQIMATTTITEQISKVKVNSSELNYYEQNDIEKDNDMAKVIDNYNLFINTLKITFGEVEECNAATQQLYHIRQKTSSQKYVMKFQQICVNTD